MENDLREFYMPTRIVMGRGAVQNVIQELSKLEVKRVLIITDPGVEKAGVVDPIKRELESNAFYFALFSEVKPDPSTEIFSEAYSLYLKERCQGILAVGGGSSIDTGKGVSILATNGGNIEDYDGMGIYKNPPAPLVVMPTTVGTGSEVTKAAVVTDLKNKKKLIVRGMNSFARVAILDPELLPSLSPRITASTGMDALTHAVEGYVALTSSPITDALHRHAILMIGKNLRAAVANSKNLEAMGNMLFASTITGIAFTNSLLGLVHAMSHPLGAYFHVPHGDANAILLPHVMRFNWIAKPERFADITILLGGDPNLGTVQLARISADIVSDLARDVGIPSNLTQVGVDKNAAEVLAQAAVQEVAFTSTNPRPPLFQDIVEIYKSAM